MYTYIYCIIFSFVTELQNASNNLTGGCMCVRMYGDVLM